jgi:integrase
LHTISRYKGFLCRDGEIYGMKGKEMAERILSLMRAEVENGTFRIERWISETPSDVIPYLRMWLEAEKAFLSPATYKDYDNSIKNHLIPWFKANPLQLNEIRYDNLCKLLTDIDRCGKGRLNVLYCLHKCLIYAKKSGRIFEIPSFPEKSKYKIIDPVITWLPEDRQIKVINAIPEEHRPIFWWLKYHMRRPSEAMALYKEDYDKERDAFIIRRAFSAEKLIEQTKTKRCHVIPCSPEFKKIMNGMPLSFGPFFFVNPEGRLSGLHYRHAYLVKLWKEACGPLGESISLYAGLKHSSCSQYINEKGLSVDELQMLTDHASRGSVLRYADIQLETKRRLMAGKVYWLKSGERGNEENKS